MSSKSKMNRRRFLQTAALAGAGTALPVFTPRLYAQTKKLTDVTYLMPAPLTLPAFVPWVLAKQRGYYEAEGLNVAFEIAKGGVDVAKQVGAGNALVGGALGDTPIIARANGVPVKAVAVMGGGSLSNLVVHESSGINGPADLKGKSLTVLSFQETTYYVVMAMLSTANLTKNDVNIIAAGPAGGWQLFAAGKAEATAGPPEWAVYAEQAGAKTKIFRMNTWVKSMAQAILASDEAIAKHPDMVKKLVDGTLKGLADIMKGPKAVVADFVAASPSFKGKEAMIETVLERYIEYVYSGQKTLGVIDPDRMAAMQKIYVDEGIVQKETPLAELYTNRFVS
jgi:NitT/TauT family transport system substrate-binding protein